MAIVIPFPRQPRRTPVQAQHPIPARDLTERDAELFFQAVCRYIEARTAERRETAR